MDVLAIYYTDPVDGRQKFVIPNPSTDEIEHYLWVKNNIRSVPAGRSVGVFGARMVLPVKTIRRDWLLDRRGIGQIRIEQQDQPSELWSDVA